MTQFIASLWGDEAWAATLAVKPILEIIKIVAKDTSPPLYYLFLHGWLKFFGTSEWAIRSLSFLFFLFTCFTAFLIGKHLEGRKSGFLAALLTFTNPFLFRYAFEGRMYTLLLLTSTLSIYFFLKKQKVGFVLATTAALYTHHFSLFVVFWEFIWSVFKKKEIKSFFLIGLLYLPWLYPLYYQTSLVASGFWLGKPMIKTVGETIIHFLVGTEATTGQILALGAIIVTLFLRRWQRSLFLLGWFFTPLILTFLISQFFQSIFYDRYMLIVIPASALLFATERRKFSLWPILVIILVLAMINLGYFFHPTKKPFKELALFIKKEAPGITLINYNAASHHLWETKYYGLKAPIFSLKPLPFYTGTALMEKNDVINQLPNERIIGVITSAPLQEVIIPNYHEIKNKSFGQLSFLWMEKD